MFTCWLLNRDCSSFSSLGVKPCNRSHPSSSSSSSYQQATTEVSSSPFKRNKWFLSWIVSSRSVSCVIHLFTHSSFITQRNRSAEQIFLFPSRHSIETLDKCCLSDWTDEDCFSTMTERLRSEEKKMINYLVDENGVIWCARLYDHPLVSYNPYCLHRSNNLMLIFDSDHLHLSGWASLYLGMLRDSSKMKIKCQHDLHSTDRKERKATVE